MKTIKWLWSIAFAFMIVLFYAAVTSFFVTPSSEWYLALIKTMTPAPMLISIGWATNYILSIIVLTGLIYRHDNRSAIIYMIVLGLLQIVWSIVFFAVHSLLGGFLVQLCILAVAVAGARTITSNRVVATILYVIITIWYVITTVAGYNILIANL